MSSDPGKTHYVGDGCQPAHDPRIDQAHTSTVLCKPCRTYHLDHAPELRAEVENLRQAIEQTWRPEVKALRRQMGKWQLDFENEAKENERLQADIRGLVGLLEATEQNADRLRAALTEITELDLEGDASLADAMGIADLALNPPPLDDAKSRNV